MESKKVRSTCELCNAGCGVLISIENGKPAKVTGDPDNPINRGEICVKCRASLEYLYHPNRLKHPLKRQGRRGEGKWQQITWDEALDTIATQFTRIKGEYGAESIVLMRGCAKGYQDSYLGRFANVLGTPNVASMAHVCYVPRASASMLTYGFMALPDYEQPPACIVMWGVNTAESAIGEARRANEALAKGAKLMVIDPWRSGYAQKADLWVRPRPCSDLALALAMIHVIINEDLFDQDFVNRWTEGFDKLKAHVQEYSPDKVAAITWVPKGTIEKAARMYATSKPACIAWGNGIDNNMNNFQTARAISILRAITGNIGRPGGDIEWSPSGIVPKGSPELNQQDALPKDVRDKRVSANTTMLPTLFYALPQNIVRAIIEGKPYPIRAAFIQGGSVLHTYSNAQQVHRALNSLDFLVVTDFFVTPTAELADIVLPVATYLEIDSFHESEYTPNVGIIQKVAEVGECWSDLKIYIELAKRLKLDNYVWQNEKQALDYILKPAGLTFDEFRNVGVISGKKLYRKHEKDGFNTPSKKVELYSQRLQDWGFEPIPVYHEPPESPIGSPEMAREYPLTLTNFKLGQYKHSGGRQIASLRKTHPDPLAHVNDKTAKKLGIKDGDWVYIESKRGRIKQKAAISSEIDPNVIIAEHGWWYPEKDSDLHAWAESNLNILTESEPPFSREMGSPLLRGTLCKVYKTK